MSHDGESQERFALTQLTDEQRLLVAQCGLDHELKRVEAAHDRLMRMIREIEEGPSMSHPGGVLSHGRMREDRDGRLRQVRRSDGAMAWWIPVTGGEEDGLCLHYWATPDGTIEFALVAPWDDPPDDEEA